MHKLRYQTAAKSKSTLLHAVPRERLRALCEGFAETVSGVRTDAVIPP